MLMLKVNNNYNHALTELNKMFPILLIHMLEIDSATAQMNWISICTHLTMNFLSSIQTL